MRIALIAATVATVAGLPFAAPVLAQKLPSEVEERMGIRPNSMNRDDDRRRRSQALPSDVEQRMRRQANRRYRDDGWDDYGRTQYRPARRQQFEFYIRPY
jgi:hypothetical protein